jgi:hypothetical protein
MDKSEYDLLLYKRQIAMKRNGNKLKRRTADQEDFEGYPEYPASEDIYHQFKEEKEINPEDPTLPKDMTPAREELNELDMLNDVSGDDLDIPGAELDDDQEDIGSEDEENNHYSLGDDNHEDLEVNRGE